MYYVGSINNDGINIWSNVYYIYDYIFYWVDNVKPTTIIIIVLLVLLEFTIISVYDIKINGYEGKSMCPTYGEFEIHITKTIKDLSEVKVGGIYGYTHYLNRDYYSGDEGTFGLIEHRMIKLQGNAATFKGDNCTNEERIDINRVYSKTILRIPIRGC